MAFDVKKIRTHFPSLSSGIIFMDNPGGTQVPQGVMDAMMDYFMRANANRHGFFATSQKTESIIEQARQAFADFLNAGRAEEIIFGPNMTTMTFNISRALGRTLKEGDEIIVTRLDHDANIAPWLALAERGAIIKWLDINPETCGLDVAEFEKLLSPKTKIVAVGAASNAMGTLTHIKRITALAHGAGATVFIDAVQMGPHAPIDVQDLDCDLLALSAYKIFGPHIGVMYGKYALLNELTAYKIRPHSNEVPDKFEPGTQNHEGIAGALAAINYLASVGKDYGQAYIGQFPGFTGHRLELKTAMAAIKDYEKGLCELLLRGLREMPKITLYGITDPAQLHLRTPTVSFTVAGMPSEQVAELLGQKNINASNGHYNAYETMKRLALEQSGGTVRIGLAHYNTTDEVQQFLVSLKKVNSQ